MVGCIVFAADAKSGTATSRTSSLGRALSARFSSALVSAVPRDCDTVAWVAIRALTAGRGGKKFLADRGVAESGALGTSRLLFSPWSFARFVVATLLPNGSFIPFKAFANARQERNRSAGFLDNAFAT